MSSTASAGVTEGRMTLSVVEAAGRLGISRALAYELVRRGELPSLRLGRRLVVPEAALLALLAASTANGADQQATGSQ
jgi:excisionase family DNA binding protein